MVTAGQTNSQGWKTALGLAGWMAVCFSAALFGALFSPGAWYAGLNKPAWNPPNWVFGPVWTSLYIMMAIAAWLVWRQGGFSRRKLPLAAFLAQLLANSLWSWLFFGLHNPLLGLVDIMILWVLLAWTIKLFWPVSRTSSVLLIPYLAWISFAGVLNFTLWRLNT